MKRTLRHAALLLVTACGGLALPVSGQETSPPASLSTRVRLYGRALDAVTGQPVFGATVLGAGASRAAVTDTLGLFVVEVPEADEYMVTIGQLGYHVAILTLPATATREFTTVLLDPKPIELEGLSVLVDRFERRRRFYEGSVRVLEQARLLQTPAASAYDILLNQIPVAQPCPENMNLVCTLQRGRNEPISLCLDEQPLYGGAVDLEQISAAELYMMEVYDMGRSVRVYTRRFIENTLDSGRNLEPLAWGCR